MKWINGVEALAEWLHDYGAILFGLAIGAIAHLGRRIAAGEPTGAKEVTGYLMQLGLVGLLASVSTRYMGIVDDDTRALTTAILAISAQEVMQYLRRNGWQPIATNGLPPNGDNNS